MMFYAMLCADHGYIHVPADRMDVQENMIYAYLGECVVAVVDIGVVLFAHISERRRSDGRFAI